MFLKMCAITADRLNNQSASDLYLSYSTKVKVNDLEEINSNIVLITTTHVLENRGIITDKWTEITFKIKYDVTHQNAVELIEKLGYNEFKNKGISLFDFMKIKCLGRKVYKFFESDTKIETQAEGRLLDLDDYDDVMKIRNYYYRKVLEYKNMISEIKMLEIDKEEYEKNSEILRKYNDKLQELLDAMSSDE